MSLSNLRNVLWAPLLPISLVWALIAELRRRFYPASRVYHSKLAVVSVGNIHSGGTGKTPITMEICRHLFTLSPVIISRGYGGTLSAEGSVVDTSDPDGAHRYGDEPWMMAHRLRLPVIVGKRRSRSLKLAESSGRHRVVVLDDAFQHLAVARDKDIVVIDAGRPPEDSFCLPLGDLREPVKALRRATALVVTRGREAGYSDAWRRLIGEIAPDVPVFEAIRRVEGLLDGDEPVAPSETAPFAAFCGIASPERFEADLSELGAIAYFRTFPDHHRYSPRDLKQLTEARKAKWARTLVTTAKDWVKVREAFRERDERLLRLEIRYEIPEEFWYLLADLREPR